MAKGLSKAEIEVARWIATEGLPNKMIAHKVGISEATVKVHVRTIVRKLAVLNRVQIAITCIKFPELLEYSNDQ